MDALMFRNKQFWQVLAITLVGLLLCSWMMVIPMSWATDGDDPLRSCEVCTATAEAAFEISGGGAG
jgi:hypothetical protein